MTTQELTSWQCYHCSKDGMKVMIDEFLPANLRVYHRLEWRYGRLIFENLRLRLSPVRDWVDPYEAWWCRELFSRPGSSLERVNAYALCWTQSNFDEPAWRMTGYGRREPIVRLRSSVRRLLGMV
jgi:hypothetical protein